MQALERIGGGVLQAAAPPQCAHCEELREEIAARQASYMRREEANVAEISELRAKLEARRGQYANASCYRSLRALHIRIQDCMDAWNAVPEAAQADRESLLALQRRLHEVEGEVASELSGRISDVGDANHNNNGNHDSNGGEAALYEQIDRLQAELNATQVAAARMDRFAKANAQDLSRLKAEVKLQHDEKNLLVKQVVSLKKENVQMREIVAMQEQRAYYFEYDRDRILAHREHDTAHAAAVEESPPTSARADGMESEEKPADTISRLRHALEAERRRAKAAQVSLSSELESRSELHKLLTEALKEAKHARWTLEKGASSKVEEMTTAEKDHMLHTLLSKEKVLALLYEAAFPEKSTKSGSGSGFSGQVMNNTTLRPQRPGSAMPKSQSRPMSAATPPTRPKSASVHSNSKSSPEAIAIAGKKPVTPYTLQQWQSQVDHRMRTFLNGSFRHA